MLDNIQESNPDMIQIVNDDPVDNVSKDRARYEVVFFARYHVNPRPTMEQITDFFSKYGDVDHVNCPHDKNFAFIFMSKLFTDMEYHRTRTTISNIIKDMTPETRFHIGVASSNRYNKNSQPRYNNKYNSQLISDNKYNNQNGQTSQPRYDNKYNNQNGQNYQPRYVNKYNNQPNQPRYKNQPNQPRYNNQNGQTTQPKYDNKYNNQNGQTTQPKYDNKYNNQNGQTTQPVHHSFST